MKDKLNQNPYQDLIQSIYDATKGASAKERADAFAKEFYPTPRSKMDALGLKIEIGLSTKEALMDNSTKDKLSFADFTAKLDKYKIKPVLLRNERANLVINYDVYTYTNVDQKVGLTRVEGALVPNQTKVYKKVDIKAEFEKLLEEEQESSHKGEPKSDTIINAAENEKISIHQLNSYFEKNLE